MKTFLLIVLAFISISGFSQEHIIDIDQLIDETQLGTSDPDEMKIVWWIPVEFWVAAFQADQSMTKKQIEETIGVLEQYSMFAIVDGKIGPFGGVTYTPLEQIKSGISLIDMNDNKYNPIDFEDLNSDTQILLSAFKPILKNMLGQMGENMHFFVFPDIDKEKNRIADPTEEGTVKLVLSGNEHVWRTPLGSVIPPKYCPVDKEKLNGAWSYCPWHGNELVEEE